jgi:hypothetical protein
MYRLKTYENTTYTGNHFINAVFKQLFSNRRSFQDGRCSWRTFCNFCDGAAYMVCFRFQGQELAMVGFIFCFPPGLLHW